ncbi:MAG: hypothetical protein JWL81_3068, partial [Verrucomicrobiales bacterium]|nr:hypothetical protein [Verrucomicrobiales bacterium]
MSLKYKLAYTLVEILITLSVIGGLSAGGYAVVRNMNTGSNQLKLEQDVRIVNNAIKVYLTHGGRLPADTTATDALLKLRRQSAELKKNAGLKSATIDPRLNLRYQTSPEAVAGGPRAYWNATEQQFYVARSGSVPGVKEFYIDAVPPPLPITFGPNGEIINPNLDDRQTFGDFASVDSWVWDFENSGVVPRNSPTFSGTSDATMTNSAASVDDDIRTLDPPRFSVAGGRYALSWFPRTLTLSPALTTPESVSEIFYIVSGGPWQLYTGPIEVNEPGATITAKSVALDLDHYADSAEAVNTYTANQVTLDPAVTIRTSYRYAELGGPLAPGSPQPYIAPVPRLYLANANDIPDLFERNNVFQMFWTWDGTSPAAAGVGRYSGITDFTDGYPGDPIPLAISNFANNNTINLKYIAVSNNAAVAVTSAVETAPTSIAITPLLSPIVTPGDGSLSGGEKIQMVVDVSGAQTPANARIYYRTDGIDPGDVNGEPAAGATLYTAPFSLDSTNAPTVRVVARVYPPTTYKRWFSTSPAATLNYYLPYAEDNVYAVLGGNKDIYNINPSTGTNQIFNSAAAYNLRALALDSARARVYYIEDNSTVPANGWRLGYLDFITGNHVSLGNLRAAWGYNATAQPQNLAFFNNGLYYIHSTSDDLVQILLNEDASGISSVTKVADLRNNSSWTSIGDIAVDETGLMFFVDSTKTYHRYDLVSMSNYLQLGTVSEDFLGLAFFQGRLFGTQTRTTSIHRMAPTTGKSLSTIGALGSRKFIDLASPSSAVPISVTKSMWGIDDQSDGPHLIEFRNNYRSPLISVAVDYGPLLYGGATLLNDTRYGIRGLAISADGMAYFVRNTKIRVSNTDRLRPLLKLNLSNLRLGDALNCEYIGDLKPGLQTMAGNIDPDDVVTGLTIAPTGELYGVLREGADYGSNSADYIFKCTQAATGMTGPNIGITSIGRTTSAAGLSSTSEDLLFTRDGRLFVLDSWDNELLEISPTTGAVLSLMSQNPGCYHGIAMDTNDYRIIASDIGGNGDPDVFLQVNGGPDNDEIFINYRERWGYQTIEAISFFQPPFLLLSNQVDIFACDGSKTIHGLDFETGQTVPVTDAPWPVRALAFDLVKREVFYLRGGSDTFTLGSFHRDTFVHKIYGNLKNSAFEYSPNELPDNLMYFGGYLWYVEPKTDNLIRLLVGSSSITAQKKVANMTGNELRFDLIGDLAMTPDGWVYFSGIRTDGQRFCRYQINTLSQFEVLSGPIPSPVLLPDGESYRENWFDALAFAPANAQGVRTLFSTYSSTPSPLHIVNPETGESTFSKNVLPSLSLIDFSDQHPGALSNPNAITLQPLLKLNNLLASYTYADVGGPFLTGFTPPPATVPGPTVVLNNANELLLSQQNSAFFQIRWSTDGIDPRTSGAASTSGTFTNGYPGQVLPISYSLWGNRAALPLKVVAKSLQTNVMIDSPMLSPTIPAERMTLDAPLISETTAINGVRQIQILPNIP